MNSRDGLHTEDGGNVAVLAAARDSGSLRTHWVCEKWEQDKVEFAQCELLKRGIEVIQDGFTVKPSGIRDKIASAIAGRDVSQVILVPRLIPVTHGVTSEWLRELVGDPDAVEEVAGNLLLNEGIGQLTNLLIGGTANAFDNANSFLGVGDTNTAAAATQTELQATQNAANRFYKGMVATYPQRSGSNNETVNFRSDFTSTEANFAWQEWTAARGATTASGSGFLVGTVNLNRKVESLGTKTTGTWTLTGSITFS